MPHFASDIETNKSELTVVSPRVNSSKFAVPGIIIASPPYLWYH